MNPVVYIFTNEPFKDLDSTSHPAVVKHFCHNVMHFHGPLYYRFFGLTRKISFVTKPTEWAYRSLLIYSTDRLAVVGWRAIAGCGSTEALSSTHPWARSESPMFLCNEARICGVPVALGRRYIGFDLCLCFVPDTFPCNFSRCLIACFIWLLVSSLLTLSYCNWKDCNHQICKPTC